MKNPMVSIFCMVYNHETYLRKCLEGFLMQQCNFDYRIVIGEDCSTDNSRAIILEYAKNYPGKFKLLLHEKNVGAAQNQRLIFENCTGKYIALCEGDDYWTDPLKLQKQVDFLEDNLEFGLVHADCNVKDLRTNNVVRAVNETSNLNYFYSNDNKILFDALIDSTYIIRTATVVIRKSCFLEISNELARITDKFLMGDTPLWLYLSTVTKFHYFDEVFSMYNLSVNSITRPGDKLKELRFNLSMAEVRVWFVNEFNLPILKQLSTRYNRSLMYYKLYNFNYEEMFPLIAPSSIEIFLWDSLKYKWLRKCLRAMVSFNFFKIVYRKMQVVLK